MALVTRIRDAISAFATDSLRSSATHLLSVLGYESDRIPAVDGVAELRDELDVAEKLTESQQELIDSWADVRAVFQYTEEEFREKASRPSRSEFNKSRAESFLFLAVELGEQGCPRGRLANMTRTVNRLFAMPVIVVYRYKLPSGALVITIAVVHRRPDRRDPSREVLERVTLVKDIRVRDPHRAHLDVLADLSLERLIAAGPILSFDQLHLAWEKALDTEPLNRRFYSELFRWFERAVAEASWPTKESTPEQQVIRCITRLLFVWFIKEKGLVADSWFKQDQIESLLTKSGGTDYYRAVLQNLFFATLNTPLDKRAWRARVGANHSGFVQWRYRTLVQDPERFEDLMAQTPFINGGLFDCLDKEADECTTDGRVDMFCDPNPADGCEAETGRSRAYQLLNVPDALFFDEEGLLTLFDRYKFTVEENTPAETEVALDPELLGRVFENLLAAFNPETRDTVRRQTGSYYTPRLIVDFMVDEALILALAEKAQPEDGDAEFWHERLRYLLDYEDAGELFEQRDAEAIIKGIANLKVLDPAVGSGAFPMAVLNKLTLALRRLDSDNELWQKLQRDRAIANLTAAFDQLNKSERDEVLLEISKTFQRYSGDFGRKLYIVQNSIYGVDIQPTACQIAMLRFFISLAIEQEPDSTIDNFGIKPLPNLETRFVAADTLIGLNIDTTGQLSFKPDRVEDLEKQLQVNRERHFHARTRLVKDDCIVQDNHLRMNLAAELDAQGFPADATEQIALWDPYNQNDFARWFDAEYMFGVSGGFDVVMGNPPYIQLQKDGGQLGRRYQHAGYKTFERTGDIYQLFIERGCRLLKPGGVLAYITSNSWLRAKYGGKLREHLASFHEPLNLLDLGKDIFDAVVDASVLIIRSNGLSHPFPGVDIDRVQDEAFPPRKETWAEVRPSGRKPWSILTNLEWRVMEKMNRRGTPLKDWADISIYRGITTGYNEAFIIDDSIRDRLVTQDPRSDEIIRPLLRGRDIQRYRASWERRWLISTLPSLHIEIDEYPAVKRHLLSFGQQRLQQSGKYNWPMVVEQEKRHPIAGLNCKIAVLIMQNLACRN